MFVWVWIRKGCITRSRIAQVWISRGRIPQGRPSSRRMSSTRGPKARSALASIALLLAAAAPAGATSLTFTTAESRFDPGVDNQGWWSDTLANQDSNENYFTGWFSGDHRGFFSFDLSSLAGAGTVTGATLELQRFDSMSGNEATERLELFDVTTDAATLNDNVGPSQAIFDDLGSGTSFGAFDVPGSGDPANVLSFELSPEAIARIDSAAGGFFSIGAALTSQDGDDGLFLASGSDGPQTLTLQIVPEPAAWSLLGAGLAALRTLRAGRSRPR